MKRIMNLATLMLVSLLFAAQAFALKPDFKSVRDYHNQEIDLLLKDYTLEESLTIRVELTRKEGELKEQEIVSLPGLYQKTGQASDRDIQNVLNLYERKIVFIKKREISNEEMELVQASLKERLFLPEDTVYTNLDNIPKLDSAVKNLKSDFIFGAYKTLIRNGQFLWILIFSIGFIVALWVLAKVWKSKSEGGGEFTISGGGAQPQADHDHQRSEDNNKGPASISLNSSEFETFNFLSFCQNMNEAYRKIPGATSHVLWQYLPDLQTQIQFYEIIRIQNQISADILKASFEVLDKVFDFENRASKNHSHKRARGFSKEDLSVISVELARLKFIEPHAGLERCYQEIYPKCADHLSPVFEQGMADHHIALYKMFKDDFMNLISSKSDDARVLSKIDDLLTFDPNDDHATDEQYSKFAQFLKDANFAKDTSGGKRSVNSKVVQMIYGLPEAELLKVEAMKNNEDLKSEIPCFSWIDSSEAKSYRDFLVDLSGAEMKYLFDFDNKFEQATQTMDERTQFRIKERISKEENMVLNWKEFRQKIKRHYNYESAGAHENKTSKAS